MLIDIFLLIIIIFLIILLAYQQKLHYSEIKGLYGKIGIEIKEKEVNKSTIKNHIKKRMMEVTKQGGE